MAANRDSFTMSMAAAIDISAVSLGWTHGLWYIDTVIISLTHSKMHVWITVINNILSGEFEGIRENFLPTTHLLKLEQNTHW